MTPADLDALIARLERAVKDRFTKSHRLTLVDAAAALAALRADAERMREALIACAAVAKAWHGDDCWEIYYEHSPEMKLVRDALDAAREAKP